MGMAELPEGGGIEEGRIEEWNARWVVRQIAPKNGRTNAHWAVNRPLKRDLGYVKSQKNGLSRMAVQWQCRRLSAPSTIKLISLQSLNLKALSSGLAVKDTE